MGNIDVDTLVEEIDELTWLTSHQKKLLEQFLTSPGRKEGSADINEEVTDAIINAVLKEAIDYGINELDANEKQNIREALVPILEEVLND